MAPVLAAVATTELEEVIKVVGHDRPLARLRVLEEVPVQEWTRLTETNGLPTSPSHHSLPLEAGGIDDATVFMTGAAGAASRGR